MTGTATQRTGVERPVVKPFARTDLEAYAATGFYCYIAQHGPVYVRTFGKRDPGYIYHTVRPNLIVVHSGVGILSEIARTSKGTYNGEYSTYSLRGLDCPELPHGLHMSIRKDSVARILPNLARFKPQLVTVPSQEEEQKRRSIWRKMSELFQGKI